jgi:hypothetical protein
MSMIELIVYDINDLQSMVLQSVRSILYVRANILHLQSYRKRH